MEKPGLPVRNLDHLLTDSYGLQLKMSNIQWKPLTDPGENFGSVIYAVDLTLTWNEKSENLHLVVKLPPSTEYFIELFNSPLTFWKELELYRNIAPALVNYEIENGFEPGRFASAIPKYYGGRLGLKNPNVFDEQAAIVMENLKPRGYVMQDRLNGLDMEHTKATVIELSKLHAVMIGLKMNKPKTFETMVLPGLVPPANETARNAVLDMVRQSHDTLKSLPEAEPYLERVEKTLKYVYDHNVDTKPVEPWGTMVHNDCWTNNMLFKYDKNNKLTGLKFVDFQLCIYDYGVKDLIFFLLSSAQKDILDNNLQEMINLYYDSFICQLRALEIDIDKFSREEFDKHLLECGPKKFSQCIMMILVTMRPKVSTEKDPQDGKDEFLNIANKTLFSDKLLHTLRIFDKMRWLAN